MYGQSAVKMTVAQFSADQICTGIHMCEAKACKFMEYVNASFAIKIRNVVFLKFGLQCGEFWQF